MDRLEKACVALERYLAADTRWDGLAEDLKPIFECDITMYKIGIDPAMGDMSAPGLIKSTRPTDYQEYIDRKL